MPSETTEDTLAKLCNRQREAIEKLTERLEKAEMVAISAAFYVSDGDRQSLIASINEWESFKAYDEGAGRNDGSVL